MGRKHVKFLHYIKTDVLFHGDWYWNFGIIVKNKQSTFLYTLHVLYIKKYFVFFFCLPLFVRRLDWINKDMSWNKANTH